MDPIDLKNRIRLILEGLDRTSRRRARLPSWVMAAMLGASMGVGACSKESTEASSGKHPGQEPTAEPSDPMSRPPARDPMAEPVDVYGGPDMSDDSWNQRNQPSK